MSPTLPSRARSLALILLAPVAAPTSAHAQGNLLTVDGPPTAAYFGATVSALGDVNSDGITDLAVGDWRSSDGAAFIVSGATGATLQELQAGHNASAHGFSLAAIGDVTGDGIPDVAVGDPSASGFRGRVEARSGATGSVVWTFGNTDSGDHRGTSVTGIGDLNGDAIPDVIVGAPFTTVGTSQNRGRLYALSGSNGSVIYEIDGPTGTLRTGYCLASTADLDGDGIDDIISGAVYVTSSPNFSGHVHVYSGASGALIRTHATVDMFDQHGRDVCGMPDLNGDGYGDYAITIPRERINGIPTAGVAMLSGATGTELWHAEGPSGGFGDSIELAGDVNGDGVPDVVVGATNLSGVNRDGGGVVVLLGDTGEIHMTIPGSEFGQNMGTGVAPMGDVDGDGYDDIAVGGDGLSVNFSGAPGRVFIHRGGAMSTELYSTICPNPPTSSGSTATLTFVGSTSLDLDLLSFDTRGLPQGTPLLYVVADAVGSSPLGPYELCVDGVLYRRPVVLADSTGRHVERVATPSLPFMAGQTVVIQAMFRDVAAPLGLGVTNAVQLTFAP